MKYEIEMTPKFRRDYKLAVRRGQNIELLQQVVNDLASGKQLAESRRDHALIGNWKGYRECHISPDWLLVYKIEQEILVLVLARTGTHGDLF